MGNCNKSSPANAPLLAKAVHGGPSGPGGSAAGVGKGDPKKWCFQEVPFGGSYQHSRPPKIEQITGSITAGIARLKEDPSAYSGMWYQANMVDWPSESQQYSLVSGKGCGFKAVEQEGGPFIFLKPKYLALTPEADCKCAGLYDEHTDDLVAKGFQGQALSTTMVGRGNGFWDVPGLRMIDDIDPNDIVQGQVGDCWLLSAISAMAEWDGAIQRLFRKTKNIESLPADQFNKYTITLFQVPNGEPIDYVLDERLLTKSNGSADMLLDCSPGCDNELWPCYLAKACAVHCGGFDGLQGGQCSHAWRFLVGTKNCYDIMNQGGNWLMAGRLDKNPNTGEAITVVNSPCASSSQLWPVPWPAVSGGQAAGAPCNTDELFQRMCKWEKANYLMGAGTAGGDDSQNTDGMVDGHAYPILRVVGNVARSGIGMIQVRNPHGAAGQEFSAGEFDDNGSGWEKYPAIKGLLKPKMVNDGCFWMTKDEFFKYFASLYLCAVDMSTFTFEAKPKKDVPVKEKKAAAKKGGYKLVDKDPKGNILRCETATRPGECDACGCHIKKGTRVASCRGTNYDVCKKCHCVDDTTESNDRAMQMFGSAFTVLCEEPANDAARVTMQDVFNTLSEGNKLFSAKGEKRTFFSEMLKKSKIIGDRDVGRGCVVGKPDHRDFWEKPDQDGLTFDEWYKKVQTCGVTKLFVDAFISICKKPDFDPSRHGALQNFHTYLDSDENGGIDASDCASTRAEFGEYLKAAGIINRDMVSKGQVEIGPTYLPHNIQWWEDFAQTGIISMDMFKKKLKECAEEDTRGLRVGEGVTDADIDLQMNDFMELGDFNFGPDLDFLRGFEDIQAQLQADLDSWEVQNNQFMLQMGELQGTQVTEGDVQVTVSNGRVEEGSEVGEEAWPEGSQAGSVAGSAPRSAAGSAPRSEAGNGVEFG